MKKSKSKAKIPASEHVDEHYHHPILEEQMIIRFPEDIAKKISDTMDTNNFNDFDITFTDEHHASVKLFGENFEAVLDVLHIS